MKSKTKKIIFIIILSVTIIVSLVFVFWKKNKNDDFITIQKTADENNQFNFSPETKNFLEALESKTETDNFTQNVITKYGIQIASQNPNGPRSGEVLLPTDATLAETMKNELQKTIDTKTIQPGDLKTREPENYENTVLYLNEIKTIIDSIKIKDISISQNFTDADMKKMGLYADTLEDVSLRLFAVSVPSSWKPLHADLVNLYKKKAVLFETMAKTNEDPLKAIVAMHELQKLSAQEISLAENFEGKIKDIKS